MTKDTIPMDDADRLMSLDEVRIRLRTSPQVVAQIVKQGLLKTLRFGNNKRVRKATFNAFLAKYDGQDLFEILKEVKKE